MALAKRVILLFKNIQQSVIYKKWYITVLGFLALIWFLIRVIPKPQRATYPCQRAAFPMASASVIWLTGTLFSKNICKKAKLAFANNKFFHSILLGCFAVLIFFVSIFPAQIRKSTASTIRYARLKRTGEELYQKQVNELSESIIDPHAVVGIVKSEKNEAEDIDSIDIDNMIRNAVGLAGGFDSLIHEGDDVIIKPNVISSKDEVQGSHKEFPQKANGVATDYRIIQVVVNMVREKNSAGKIYLIEGSGYGVTRTNINNLGYNKITGIDSILLLDEFEGEWYDTSAGDVEQVSLPAGRNLYPCNNIYYLNNIYKNADVVISLPCLKSHFLTGTTGGVKNVGIGATPVRIYGNGPGFPADSKAGRWEKIDHGDFSTTTVPLDKWIHDFYLCRPVDYVIMDGIQGVQYGPYPGSSGDSRTLESVQMNMRVILAGKDALAVDAIEAFIAGFDPYLIGHLQLLAQDEAGCINPAFIKVNGVQVHEIKKVFNEYNPGKKAKYSDFTGPAISVPTPATIHNSTLNIYLDNTDDIVKVEVSYYDTLLNCLVVNDFENITLPLKDHQTDVSKVNVMAYDKYLNCTGFTPDHVITAMPENFAEQLKIYPIPAVNYISIDGNNFPDVNLDINIFSVNGEKYLSGIINTGSDNIFNIDISNLPSGNYIIQIKSGKKIYSAKFVKS